ncbi:Catalytic domain of the Serine/Threonine Kinase Cell Division Cycle 2-like 1 [Aspergillus parasiticus SU-1]|uniref:cyclin-dependent kinase n=1 Tax=Aspergillus parasiticus (strain ATCC 56775 / NRRL 5862 / SRRC 143 / SU-1) TaxID=1403190 RepID=A0A0F0I0S9_ASPPU|nr:Catalytic domain of the Serine/Threonine Kinase Cell Division Cycle 2-like 1 [Aspergillus parasiticus SU-1]
MSSKSRWADEDPEAEAINAQRKREKEEKRRAKAEKQRQLEQQAEEAARQREAAKNDTEAPPKKRRRLSNDPDTTADVPVESAKPQENASNILQFPTQEWGPSRHVDNFERLNHIEEGSYGWVSRAKDITTGEIVALKKLKMDNSPDGFPVTGLREIQTLLEARHPNIVFLREIVIGTKMDECVSPFCIKTNSPLHTPYLPRTWKVQIQKVNLKARGVFLVMDFLEHDLKTLLDDMREPFLPSEIKTLLSQVLSGLDFLHSQWIMHRDLKTSNLLMNNRGEIKIADFGMARYYGDPPPKLTQLVVTLWYRSPELLLGAEKYGTEIDMWSIGCIFGELLTKEPLLQGKNEVDQVSKIFALTGPPTPQTWPGFRSLPNAKSLRLPQTSAPSGNPPLLPRSKFPFLTNAGLQLLSSLLALNPSSRPTTQECLSHPYFREDPRPKPKEMFPTFPSKAGMEKRRRRQTPEAPKRGQEAPRLDFASVFGGQSSGDSGETGAGFTLRLG